MEKFSHLRRRAQQKIMQQPAPELSELSSREITNLIEDLHIHRAELEIQNEELRQTQQQLEASRRRYVELYDSAPIGYFTFDPNGLIVAVNLTGASQLNLPRNDLLKQPFTDYIDSASQDTFYLHCRQVLDTQTKQSCELQLVRPDGSAFEAQLESIAVVDETGESPQIQSVLIDITERKRVERRIQLLQTVTQNISEAADFHDALASTLNSIGEFTNWDYGEAWTLDEEKKAMKCSPAWFGSHERLRQFREQSQTLTFPINVGLPGRVWALEEPEWIQEISDTLESRFTRRQLALDAGFKAALAVPFLANHRVVVVLIFFMFRDSREDEAMVDLLSTVAAQLGLVLHRKKVQDERGQLLEAVGQQREELRSLAGRLAEIQEAERQQLARELHDQVGQNLTALGFNLNAMWARLAETSTGTGSIQSQLDDSLTLVEQTTDQIRNLMAELRPPMLDEYGLVDALEWYAERFTARTGLPVDIQNKMLAMRLPISVETALLRICQEALTNAAKYAQAKQVTIMITEQEQVARLVIADDGVGFDPVEVAGDKQRRHLGLLSMRERALAVGGRWRIESQPGQGTQVIVEVSR